MKEWSKGLFGDEMCGGEEGGEEGLGGEDGARNANEKNGNRDVKFEGTVRVGLCVPIS